MARFPASGFETFSGYSDGALSLDGDWATAIATEPSVSSGVLGEAGAGGNSNGASYIESGSVDLSTTGYNETEVQLTDLMDSNFEGILPICHVDTGDTDAFVGMLWTGSILRVVEYTAFSTFDDFVDTGSLTLNVNDRVRLKVGISGGTATCNVAINGTEITTGDFPDATFSTSLNPGQPGLMQFDAEGTYDVDEFAAADTEGGIDGVVGAVILTMLQTNNMGADLYNGTLT